MATLSKFSRLWGVGTETRCLVPAPGVTRGGEEWPRGRESSRGGSWDMGSGVVSSHMKVMLTGQSLLSPETDSPWRGSLSRVSKSPSVKASEISKIKRRDEYWSFLRCVQKQKGRAREAAIMVYHTTASKSLRTACCLKFYVPVSDNTSLNPCFASGYDNRVSIHNEEWRADP